MVHSTRFVAIGVLLACAMAPAWAADNSGIVVIEKQRRVSPYGDYQSRRQRHAYGPASGFRYEQHRFPPRVPVYPAYRNRYDHRPARGNRRFPLSAAAPYAPPLDAHGHGHGPRDHHRHRHHAGHYSASSPHARRLGHARHRARRPSGRAMAPARRAIEPAERAIRR